MPVRSGHAALALVRIVLLQRIQFSAKPLGSITRLGLERTGLLHARSKFLLHALAPRGRLRLARNQPVTLRLGGRAPLAQVLGRGLRLVDQRLTTRSQFLSAVAAEAAWPGAPSTMAEMGSPWVVVAARPSSSAIAAAGSML